MAKATCRNCGAVTGAHQVRCSVCGSLLGDTRESPSLTGDTQEHPRASSRKPLPPREERPSRPSLRELSARTGADSIHEPFEVMRSPPPRRRTSQETPAARRQDASDDRLPVKTPQAGVGVLGRVKVEKRMAPSGVGAPPQTSLPPRERASSAPPLSASQNPLPPRARTRSGVTPAPVPLEAFEAPISRQATPSRPSLRINAEGESAPHSKDPLWSLSDTEPNDAVKPRGRSAPVQEHPTIQPSPTVARRALEAAETQDERAFQQGPAQSSTLGRTVGNVRIVAQIGHGGMGTVYKAEHQVLRTPYAVKVLKKQLTKDRRVIERFRREAVACSRLHHPNVVFVTDFGYERGLGIYIIMEYLNGESLADVVFEERTLEVGRAIRIGLQICDALEAAHKLGIVHRDLKAENVQLCTVGDREDFVKVLDFGIARLKASSLQLTAVGMVLGSPHYMSPEQIQGLKDQVGACSDIYALGIIFYEMLVGDVPFDARNPIDICKLHLLEPPPLVSEARSELKGTLLEDLIARMLAKDPEGRPPSMRSVANELEEALAELQTMGMAEITGPVHLTQPMPELSLEIDPEEATRRMKGRSALRLLSRAESGSPVHVMCQTLSGVENLPSEELRLLFWGAIQRVLLDAPLDSPEMELYTEFLLHFLTEASREEEESLLESPWLRSLSEFLKGLEENRQRQILKELDHLISSPTLPDFIWPQWAGVRIEGSWKSISGEHSIIEAPAEDIELEEEVSFLEKLRQPVSVQAFKNVLNHDLGLFRRRRREEEESEEHSE